MTVAKALGVDPVVMRRTWTYLDLWRCAWALGEMYKAEAAAMESARQSSGGGRNGKRRIGLSEALAMVGVTPHE